MQNIQRNQINHKELVHSDYQIREVEAVVRRDAFTTIHVQVPPYETNILRNLFGRENVSVFEHDFKTTITPEHEYDRLCAKYSHEVVAKVFGEDDGDRLMEIVEGLMLEGEESVKVAGHGKKAKPFELETTEVQKVNKR